MRKLVLALVVAAFALLRGEAHAQSSPGLSYGQVPTAGQWNSYFAAKADYPGFLAATNTWSQRQTFNNGITVNSIAPLSGNGVLISGTYGSGAAPVSVGSTASAIALSAFLQTIGDIGQTQYTGLFNQQQVSAGQGGNFYSGVFLSQMSGTWIPTASGISGAIGMQGGGISSRGGYSFGGNYFCTTSSVAAAQCVANEGDTNNTINGTTDKIAFQAVDISTSTGTTTGISAAFLVGAQAGANLYGTGFQISVGNGVFPIKATGTGLQITGGTVAQGVDLNGLTCSTDCFRSNGFTVDGGGVVTGAALVTPDFITTNPATLTGTSGSTTSMSQIINSSGTFTLTLPSAAASGGRWLYIKSIASNAVNSASSNIVPLGSTTAAATIFTSVATSKWVLLQSDATNWITMAGSSGQ